MGKLSRKDKVKIVRDAIIKQPRYWGYGWNKAVMEYFKKEHDLEFHDSYFSKLKTEAIEEMKNDKSISLGKETLIDMHLSIYQNKNSTAVDKTRSLIEIGKLQGDYEEKLRITEDETNGELKALAERIIKKKLEEKNGKKVNQKKEKENEKNKSS